jgi:hypothetical protein
MKKSKKIEDKSKQRETVPMDRFECHSRLDIAITHRTNGVQDISIRLLHAHRHDDYVNVAMPPAAFDLVLQHIDIAKPADLLPVVQALDGCGHVSGAQVYRAWTELSEVIWRRDVNPAVSAQKLLEEYEEDGKAQRLVFALPDGVTAIAWALPEIAHRVAANIKEVALDATCEFHSI